MQSFAAVLPTQKQLYYGGLWHSALSGQTTEVFNPANGQLLDSISLAGPEDAQQAIAAAVAGFYKWRDLPPLTRAQALKALASRIRDNAQDIALLDCVDSGNPLAEMLKDVELAAIALEYFAGLITEIKGHSTPSSPAHVNFSVREPLGVVARIVPFNHPFMLAVNNIAAPLAAGNSVIVKPPLQSPLSALRLAELADGIFPPGVFNVLNGGNDLGAALVADSRVAMVGLIGSVPTGQAVMQASAATLKPLLLELGGKNPLIACPDAPAEQVAQAVVNGMNLNLCGQSCGSTSRAFIHASIYDEVVSLLSAQAQNFVPDLPWLDSTNMGCINNQALFTRIQNYIEIGRQEANLLVGGKRPAKAELDQGFFLEPTIFTDVSQNMRIAAEEIFGPVLSVMKWEHEEQLLKDVNSLEYGLTASIWTRDIARAHRLARSVEAGYVWVNETSKHFLGAPFGGYKMSGIGRAESIDELLGFTQIKHLHINLQN